MTFTGADSRRTIPSRVIAMEGNLIIRCVGRSSFGPRSSLSGTRTLHAPSPVFTALTRASTTTLPSSNV